LIEVNKNDNTKTELSKEDSEKLQLLKDCHRLLQIESKNLNSDNEMIRRFGAKTVQNERAAAAAAAGNQQQQRGRGHQNPRGSNSRPIFRSNTIVNKKDNWPEFKKLGLSMSIVETKQIGNTDNKIIEFTFNHNKEYQTIQHAFLDAVESMDHNNIMGILQICPYHIDSLIQLSDVSRMQDDTQIAAILIERALFAIQNSFHSLFNITTKSGGSGHFLNYNRVENRGIYICLFKHVNYVGGKACYRTALELTKLLLSFDIVGDPLAAILLLDFYAIRSSQYEYLIDFYETFNPTKHLYLLPNMAMSTALAHFYLYDKTKDANHLDKSNQMLQECLIRFPVILMEILDKCGIIPDKEVEKCWIFAKTSHLK
jgi:hypothetical protein